MTPAPKRREAQLLLQPKQHLEDQAGASLAATDFAVPACVWFAASSKGRSLEAKVNVAGLQVWVQPRGLVQSQPGQQGEEDGDVPITQSWPP